MSASVMTKDTFESDATGSTIDYRTLSPARLEAGERLPLILHLHGAMSSADFLEIAKPVYDSAWSSGALPRAVVACASTPTLGGFYIDHPRGQAWERLVGAELPERLATRLPLSERRAVIGFSMGGYGALKLAFRDPDRYRGVAALCPAIFPTETSASVPEKNRPSILDDLNRAMGETTELYGDNCVQTLLRRRREAIAASDLGIFLECGQADAFGLHDGAQHLHHLLETFDIGHEWRSTPGVGHADNGAARLGEALDFLGRALA